MNSFLDQVFLGNTVRDYLWAAGVILFVIVLNRLISRYIAVLTSKLLKRAWTSFDEKKFVELIINPLGTFLIITTCIIALYRLSLPESINFKLYKYSLRQIFLSLAITIQIVAFIWLLLRIIDYISSVLEARANLTPGQGDNQLIVFFRDFFKVITGIIGLLMVLHFAFSYNIGSLLTGLSIVGAAIALALRESLENLIASFVIFFDKPFTTGDNVKVQHITGTVERIGLRSTRVRTSEKSYVTVPNKQMVDSILDNISLRSQIRGEINLLLDLDTPPEKIQELQSQVRAYLTSLKQVDSFNILLNDIRIQGYVLFIEFFTPPIEWNQFTAVRQSVNYHILQTMEALEVRIQPERSRP